ncbi:hypothetical protein [Verrucomicrobium spinosum]|uniref:hypothetical protein n=1 Tax=Verrucomicrobium spinosum TaxID=2736 RepID=UPI0001744985|nr:hypothetical protein [Verrucomicrobium spinosum]
MTNSIFQGKQYRALEDRSIAAAHALHLKVPDLLRIGLTRLLYEIEETGTLALSLDGSPPAPSVKKAKPDILTPKTRRRIEAIDSTFDGGWLEGLLQDLLETTIAEDWTAATVKPFMPPTVFYSQFIRLKGLREAWIAEDNPMPAPEPDRLEKGLTDGRGKPGRKKRPHPLFGDTPRKAA